MSNMTRSDEQAFVTAAGHRHEDADPRVRTGPESEFAPEEIVDPDFASAFGSAADPADEEAGDERVLNAARAM